MSTSVDIPEPVIAGYRIEERIAAGGMGVVYKATDEARQATVAIKVLKAADSVRLERFRGEFRTLVDMEHPSLLRVHDFGYFDDGRAWFVMDWIDGEALSRKHVFDSDDVFDMDVFATLVADISAALEYIHSQHVIHGDLKPENILIVRDGRTLSPRIMDFGLSGTQTGEGLSGTIAYMPPEIIRGEAATEASDLYSLGCVLYETLTGRTPFEAETAIDILRMHLHAAVPPLPSSLPDRVVRWISTLMEKQPQRRYRSAYQLHRAACEALGRDVHMRGSSIPRGIRLPELVREQESARMAELSALSRERPVTIRVSGPEGAGVSRFLRSAEADLRLEGMRALRTRTDGSNGIFDPILRILCSSGDGDSDGDPRYGVLAAAFPDAFPTVSSAALPELTPDGERIRLFHAAAELLCEGEIATALIIDNADRADTFTLDFLDFLVSWLEASSGRGFLLLLGADEANLAVLPDPSAHPDRHDIHLAPMSRQQTAALLEELFGHVSPSFVDVIQRQSKGLPGRVEELLNFCEAEGILEASAHGWVIHERDNLGSVFPATMTQRYQQAVEGLDADARDTLTVIAAGVIPLSAEAISAATGRAVEALRPHLALLQRKGLIESFDTASFPAHAAVRNAIENAGADIHRALYAYFLERPPTRDRDTVLARHALSAGAGDEALPLLLSAATLRESGYDLSGAVRLLRDALGLASDNADLRFDILDRLTHLCNTLGERDDEQEYIEEMLLLAAQANSPARLATVYRNQTEYHLALADYERARRSVDKALGYFTQADDLAGQAFCHQKLGLIDYRTKPGESVLRHYETAQQLFSRAHAAADEGAILVDIGLVYYSILENPDRALECFEQAREIFERIGHQRGLIRVSGNIGMQYFRLGRYEDALRYHAQANELARGTGDRRLLAISCGSMGHCEMALCRYSPALLHLSEELRIARELNDQYLICRCLENLGVLYLTLGAFDESIEAYTEARRLAEEGDDRVGMASAAIDIAGCHIERRDFDAAQKLLTQAEHSLSEAQDVNVRAMLLYRQAMLLLARGNDEDHDKALATLGKLGDIADRHGFDSHSILARSYSSLAHLRLGRLAAAHDLSADAIQLLGEKGPLYGGSHDILFNHALALRANRESADATEFIERAHAELLRCAESIAEPLLYRSFLENVQTNAVIVREYALAHRSDSPGSLTAIREQNLRTLYDVARKINSVLDPEALLDNIMDNALEAMNGERGLIFLIEDDQLVLKVSRNVEKETIRDATEISLSILQDVLHAGKPIIVSDTSQDDSFSRRDSVVNFNIHSLICVPMRSRDRIIGTVYVDSRSDAVSAMSFSDIDAEFLEAFANLATIAIENARLHHSLKQENLYLRREVQERFGFESIVGSSAPMQRLFSETQVAINNESSVLIYGESGTGKELIAKAIHYNGPRKDRHFVAVDCGALPDTLLESELFGYKRGAFTGAVTDKAGLFEEAHQGTLFLDEISNTSLAFQAKLLRVLQEGEFRRVGDPGTRTVNVRIICATNTDLQEEIANNRFRQDLFYRLNVIPITIPPLRDRISDLPELVEHFISKYNQQHSGLVTGASTEMIEHLQRLPWKGNVRELENLVNRMIAHASDAVLTAKMLPNEYSATLKTSEGAGNSLEVSLRAPRRLTSMVEVEREHISFVLKHCNGNKTEAAKILGLKRTTLVERMKKLGMM